MIYGDIIPVTITSDERNDWNNKANKSNVITTTLNASNWEGTDSPYIYSLTIDGITNNSNQEILPSINITAEELDAYQSANIQDGGQSTNTIILKAFGDKPNIDIPIRIIKRGD